MQKTIASFICGSLLALAVYSQNALYADSVQIDVGDNQCYYYDDDRCGDIWYGPGFYYGVWFDSEPNYWEWRQVHWNYPPNRNYYHNRHPIEYHEHYRRGNGGGHNMRGQRAAPGGRMQRGGGGHGGHGGHK
jgi:hypothetical protein